MASSAHHPELAPYLKDADYTDIKTIDGPANLEAFIAGMLSYYPWWLVWLYKTREILVRLLGLERHEASETLPSYRPEEISFTPGEQVSFFTVCEGDRDRIWVSETPEDKHLAAYLAVAASRLENGQTRFTVMTAVRYLHWTGPVYFNLIRPFHHLVVWRMMKAGASTTT